MTAANPSPMLKVALGLVSAVLCAAALKFADLPTRTSVLETRTSGIESRLASMDSKLDTLISRLR